MVRKIADIFVTLLGDFNDDQIKRIECAALLHDISKYKKDGKKNKDKDEKDIHHKKGKEFIEKKSSYLESLGYSKKDIEKIQTMVRFHSKYKS